MHTTTADLAGSLDALPDGFTDPRSPFYGENMDPHLYLQLRPGFDEALRRETAGLGPDLAAAFGRDRAADVAAKVAARAHASADQLEPVRAELRRALRGRHTSAHAIQQAFGPEILADAQAIMDRYLEQPRMAEDLRAHEMTLTECLARTARKDRAVKAHAERLRRETCPICGFTDRAQIGEITTRSLLPGENVAQWPAGPDDLRHFHSCARCFAVRSAALTAAWAAEINDSGVTRATSLSTHA